MIKPFYILTVLFLMILNVVQAQNMPDEDIKDNGLFIGVTLMGTSFNLPDINEDSETGGGIGLKLGYDFNTNVALFASLDGSNINPDTAEDYTLGHFDLGVEGRLGDHNSSFRPFAKVSFLGAAARYKDEDVDAEISGNGFGAGVGIYYFINRNFAVELGYTHSWINIKEARLGSVSVDYSEDARSGRLGLGASYHF